MSKYYYERSGILESKINITYHELFCKTDEELDVWIEEVRQYIIEDWDERGTPPMVGQTLRTSRRVSENYESMTFMVSLRKMMMVMRMSLRISISLPMV